MFFAVVLINYCDFCFFEASQEEKALYREEESCIFSPGPPEPKRSFGGRRDCSPEGSVAYTEGRSCSKTSKFVGGLLIVFN